MAVGKVGWEPWGVRIYISGLSGLCYFFVKCVGVTAKKFCLPGARGVRSGWGGWKHGWTIKKYSDWGKYPESGRVFQKTATHPTKYVSFYFGVVFLPLCPSEKIAVDLCKVSLLLLYFLLRLAEKNISGLLMAAQIHLYPSFERKEELRMLQKGL